MNSLLESELLPTSLVQQLLCLFYHQLLFSGGTAPPSPWFELLLACDVKTSSLALCLRVSYRSRLRVRYCRPDGTNRARERPAPSVIYGPVQRRPAPRRAGPRRPVQYSSLVGARQGAACRGRNPLTRRTEPTASQSKCGQYSGHRRLGNVYKVKRAKNIFSKLLSIQRHRDYIKMLLKLEGRLAPLPPLFPGYWWTPVHWLLLWKTDAVFIYETGPLSGIEYGFPRAELP